MKIGLQAHPRKPRAQEIAESFLALVGKDVEVEIGDECPHLAPARPHRPLEEMRVDVVVAIGGDGTFLHTLARSSAPLLPINAGTVGVLAEVGGERPKDLAEVAHRLLGGEYHLEEKMRLAAQLDGRALPDAVNEYVLHGARAGKMGLFEVAIDGEAAGEIRADGLIVATPTGSTAYSLSSAGPIVDPDLDALVLTAIAPFRAEARAIVIEPLHTLRLTHRHASREAVTIVDGDSEFPMPAESALTVYRSPRKASFVRFGTSFYQRLRGKRILPWSEPAGGDAPAHLPSRP